MFAFASVQFFVSQQLLTELYNSVKLNNLKMQQVIILFSDFFRAVDKYFPSKVIRDIPGLKV